MSIKVITTGDGSSSLFLPEINETYHSTHGAMAESQHVFIREGLQHYASMHGPTNVNVLEIGFGTGLNALLTAIYALEFDIPINYHSLETNILDNQITNSLNYDRLLDHPASQRLFRSIHSCSWNEEVAIDEKFTLSKIHHSIQDHILPDEYYNVIYFDAFAPSKQADMWELEIFNKIQAATSNKGVLVTYCAQGQFKRDLTASGFSVERLPGPPGKKEMTRGTK